RREFGALPQRGRAVFALLVNGVKIDADRGQLFLIIAVTRRHAFDGVHGRFGRRHAATHVFDDRVRAVDEDALFTQTGRACRADLVANIQPATDQRRIADAARDFPRQTGGRRHAGNVPVGVDGQTVDRAGRALAQNLFDTFIESDLLGRKSRLRGLDG